MYSLNFFIKKSPFFEKFNTFNMSFYDNSVCTEVKSPQTTAPDLNNQTVRFKSDTNLIIFFNSFAVFDKKLFVALKIERRNMAAIGRLRLRVLRKQVRHRRKHHMDIPA